MKGFCDRCNTEQFVISFEVEGEQYNPKLCKQCLLELAEQITEEE
jgi:hypothetical protein